MIRHAYAFSFLTLLLLTSCTNQTVVREEQPAELSDQLTIAEVENTPYFQNFLSDLNQRNVELTSAHKSVIGWLNAAPGISYRTGRYSMHIHLYPDAAAAQKNASEIPENVAAMTISWIAKPHFFLCERIIALYLGSDESVIAALTDLCGKQFAGFLE